MKIVPLLLLVALCWSALPSAAQDPPPATPYPVITPDNAMHLQQVGMIGRGEPRVFVLSADGQTLVVGSDLGIWLYDTDHLNDRPRWISSYRPSDVALSPDGQWLAFTTFDHGMWLVHRSSGYRVPVQVFERIRRQGLAFSPDSRVLVMSDADSPIIRRWSIDESRWLDPITDQAVNRDFWDFRFSPDGQYLVSIGSKDTTIWCLDTGLPAVLLPGDGFITDAVFTADSQYLYLVGAYLMVLKNTGETFVTTHILTPQQWRGWRAFLSADERVLTVSDWYSSTLWDTSTLAQIGDPVQMAVVGMLPNNDEYIGTLDGQFGRCLLGTATCRTVVHEHETHALRSLTFSDNATRLYTLVDSGIVVWNTMTQEQIAIYPPAPPYRYLGIFALQNNGTDIAAQHPVDERLPHRVLVVASQEQYAFWDMATGDPLLTVPPVLPVFYAVSASGHTLATLVNTTIRTWDVLTATQTHTLESEALTLGNLALSPDGRYAAAWNRRYLEVWSVDDEQLRYELGSKEDDYTALAFSQDNRWLFAAEQRGTVTILDLAHGLPAVTFNLWPRTIRCWALSPDGRLMVGIADPGGTDYPAQLVVWDTVTHIIVAQQRISPYYNDNYPHLVFSPDGTRLASSSYLGPIQLWAVVMPAEE